MALWTLDGVAVMGRMVGFLSLLTKKQQEMAMSYTGPENIGDDQFRIHPTSASTPTTPTHASASPSGQPQQGTPLDPPKPAGRLPTGDGCEEGE